MKKMVRFNDALNKAAQCIKDSFLAACQPVFVRDIYGRVRVAINEPRGKFKPDEISSLSESLQAELAAFADPAGQSILFQDDFFEPDTIFKSVDILNTNLPGLDAPIRLLDRQVIGQDWLRTPFPLTQVGQKSIPRVVFYGLKGGVGRSTALTILAYEFARRGKKVLLFDFDLESPGISSLLLPPDRLPDFGIVDWFVEDAVGQGDKLLNRIIAPSPLAENLAGEIRVAAAMGINEEFYLPKLARVYADLNKAGKPESFAERMHRLIQTLEKKESPDVVLIDSRAGLHDLAAISITRLGANVFLFATNSAQTWNGYHLLFSHWQAHPEALQRVRDRLTIVDAMIPETEQEGHHENFLENAHKLFTETIYEEIKPNSEPDLDVFNFDLKDETAPHYPFGIKWNRRFQEFEPLRHEWQILGEADIAATYGDFLNGVMEILNRSKHG